VKFPRTIAARMVAPMLLAFAPVAFLLYFLVHTHERSIATARNEISGVPVVAAVSRLRHAIIEEQLGGDADVSRTEAAAARAIIQSSLQIWPGEKMLAVPVRDALFAADAYARSQTLSANDVDSLINRVSGLYAAAANASELILDPDLDSYYLMDLQVNRLPAMIVTLWSLHRASTEPSATDGIRAAKSAGYRELLRDQSAAVMASADFARVNQRHPELSAALDPAQRRLEIALRVIGAADGPESATSPLLLEALFAARGLEQVVAEQLAGLLAMRIADHSGVRNQQITIALALIVLVMLILTVSLNRVVVQPIRDVTKAMRALASGDLHIGMSGAGRRDEIGAMVQAIDGFRGIAVERMRLEEEAAAAARSLKASTAALERAERAAALGNWRYDLSSQRLSWSKAMFILGGFDPDLGEPGLDAIASSMNQADLLRLVGAMESLTRSEPTLVFDIRVQHPALGGRHLRLWIEVEFDARGIPQAVFGTAQDVTELKISQFSLEQRTQALAEAQAIGRIGNWSWSFGSTFINWSAEVYHILGLEPDAFTPDVAKVQALYADGSLELVAEAHRQVVAHRGTEAVDVTAIRSDGEKIDLTVTTKADLSESGHIIGFVGTIQDITARKRAERDLQNLAFHDPLTGLGNRAYFQRSVRSHIEAAQENDRKAALILIDLDKFKEVNDGLGHDAGDELLGIVAQRLRRSMPQDVFLARLGGDEFAVIIPDADDAAAGAIGENILEMLGQVIQLKRGEASIGASLGCAIIPDDGVDAEDLLRKADLALYKAKDDGRNRLQRFLPELSEAVLEKTRLARDLRRALIGTDELEVHYQPQVDIARGRVVGFEALLRWRHRERGLVSPSVFIPIAESSGLIGELGLWVLRESCVQGARWLDEGHPPRDIAVNVSAIQLWQGTFEEDVRQVLEGTGFPPGLLTLEVTESVFVREAEGRIARILDNLRGLGVKLALDDFGTGYSSLGYLNSLPFHKLKIDRVFISNVDHSPRRQRLLNGILELGRGLGLSIVAEGAERLEEVAFLKRASCDRIQGFAFSQPVEAEHVVDVCARIEQSLMAREGAASNPSIRLSSLQRLG
jgi:diguanylate cyclase (GGDEF)-like protein/PAS domain S-box-containing protein